MSKIFVPSPPIPTVDSKTQNIGNAPKAEIGSPLDAGFVGRIYRTMLWFGVISTIVAAFALRSWAPVSSIIAGLVLAAVLLKTQEWGIRTMLRPTTAKVGNLDVRLLIVLLLPIKFIVIVAGLATLNYFKLIQPGYLALGFFLGELVIIAKVCGWLVNRALKK